MQKMKRVVAILVIMTMLLSLAACGSGNQPESPNNDTMPPNSINSNQVDSEKTDLEKEFDSHQMGSISFYIPKGWEEIFTQNSTNNYMSIFSPDASVDSFQNAISVYYFEGLKNVFASEEGMFDYMEEFQSACHMGFNTIDTNVPDNNVPELVKSYTQTDSGYNREVESHLYLLSSDELLIIDYYHDKSAKDDYANDFAKALSGLEFRSFSYSIYEKSHTSVTPSFTNKFGTPDTKCAHSGCNNKIASSGDTNCCEEHSNKCPYCGAYIDEDASICMTCIENAVNGKN